MTKEDAKLTHSLVSLYISMYKDKYGRDPKVNRHREKWAMQDVIDSVGYDRSKELLEYYFKVTKPGHPLSWFFYNFDKLDEMSSRLEEDKARRTFLRNQTKKMVEENE
jgi:hypothetical protein